MMISMRMIFAAGAIAASAVGQADIASSADYSFEYATTGSGARTATSSGGSYSVVDFVTTDGAAPTPTSSASYSMVPVTGSETTGPAAGVGDWVLY